MKQYICPYTNTGKNIVDGRNTVQQSYMVSSLVHLKYVLSLFYISFFFLSFYFWLSFSLNIFIYLPLLCSFLLNVFLNVIILYICLMLRYLFFGIWTLYSNILSLLIYCTHKFVNFCGYFSSHSM